MSERPLKLAEIATRIDEHLRRIEWANPDRGKARPKSLWCSGAYRGGARIRVCYVSYQGSTTLSRTDALRYLAWLDAGNNGRHYECFEEPPHG